MQHPILPSRLRGPSVPIWSALLFCALTSITHASLISEISLTSAAARPAYIEITLSPSHRNLELVILDASLHSETLIRQVVPIHASDQHNLVLIHDAHWPDSPILNTLYLPLTKLDLGQQFPNAARRLALFDAPTGWQPGSAIPHPRLWPNSTPPLDQLALQLGSWPIGSTLDEPRIQMTRDQAAWRIRIANAFTDQFTIGPVSSLGAFPSGHEQDPAIINRAAHMPEPASASLLLTLLATTATLTRHRTSPTRA